MANELSPTHDERRSGVDGPGSVCTYVPVRGRRCITGKFDVNNLTTSIRAGDGRARGDTPMLWWRGVGAGGARWRLVFTFNFGASGRNFSRAPRILRFIEHVHTLAANAAIFAVDAVPLLTYILPNLPFDVL